MHLNHPFQKTFAVRSALVSMVCCALGVACLGQPQLPKRYQIADSPQAAAKPVAAVKGPSKKTYSIDVPASQQWTDSGVDLLPGTRLQISATGSLQYDQLAGPDGIARGWKDLLRVLPLKEAGRGALIGRVGDGAMSGAFLIGSQREFRSTNRGRLFLGLNQMTNEAGDGSYRVTIQVLDAGSESTPEVAALATDTSRVVKVPGLDAALFGKIPRRIADAEGNAGDMVNFLIVGGEDQMRKTFSSAGWVVVDRTKKDAILHGLIATLSKQAYVELPMSELNLFGRPQDFGMAHAEPFAVVASRHHLRLWKAPFELNGQTVWVGAATHDIGFDKDQRNNGVTHKIDPNIDDERKYVAQSLAETGLVADSGYFLPPSPMKAAKTATGGSFHSDGKVLILALGGASNRDSGIAFADVFCTVLEQEHPDAGTYGPCSEYLEAAPRNKAALGTISTDYRVLIVPGVFSACVESTASAYKEGVVHLKEKHGVTVETLSMPNASSESNGQLIAQYLKDHRKGDARKYIVLGYSKGAPDLQVALANDAEAASGVAALITVAGAVGGSPIADVMPAQADKWLKAYNAMKCEGDLSAAFQSLQRGVRQAFLARHPEPTVPSYSLAAVSDRTNTSKMMMENWVLMSVYDSKQDSQLIRGDTIVPGGVDLGTARGDHFAVALPFESSDDASVRSAIDKNHYPRTALLESLLRFVTEDLKNPKAPVGAR